MYSNSWVNQRLNNMELQKPIQKIMVLVCKKSFDYTPFYVRYNTGLHISENGKQFSQLIETLILNYPTTIVDEIVIIAHSMGGLVTSYCIMLHYKMHIG